MTYPPPPATDPSPDDPTRADATQAAPPPAVDPYRTEDLDVATGHADPHATEAVPTQRVGPYPPAIIPPTAPTAPIPGAAYPLAPTRQFDQPPLTRQAPLAADPTGQPGYPPPPYAPAAPAYAPSPPTAFAPPPGRMPSYAPPAYPQPESRPGPPPRRRNGPLIALVIVIGLLLCAGTATAGVLGARTLWDKVVEWWDEIPPVTDPEASPSPPESPAPPAPTVDPGTWGTKLTVVYEVTGDGTADITYTDGEVGAPKRVADTNLPWTMEVEMTSPAYASVTAFRTQLKDGKVRCKTTINGTEVAEKEAEGTFGLVFCAKWQS